MPDMRDELADEAADETQLMVEVMCDWGGARAHAAAVLDSIPPGSYKREDGTWCRLIRCSNFDLVSATVLALYTEVDHAD